MADALYLLTAVVAIGLVAWVLAAFQRNPAPEAAPDASANGDAKKREAGAAAQSKVSATPGAKAPAKQPPPKEAPARPASPLAPPTPTDTLLGGPPEILVEDEPTGPNSLILVTAVGRTDPGLKRAHNEDAYVILEDKKLFVIADGMGKHAAGEVASQLCVEAISEAFRAGPVVDATLGPKLPMRGARLRAAILAANRRVLAAAEANEKYHGMGTTVVSAYFSPSNQRVYIGHVGDSRCYRHRDGELVQLTADHTLGAAGIVGKSSALLSRAVGVEESVEVDVLVESPQPGDIYLLCSDGLSRMVPDDLIKTTLESVSDLDEVTRVLIAKANEQGGRDNITTILVRVDGPVAT